jgi:2-dehydro-3-deoxyphosphogluconate aldolase / (4S)-4-hydroxy-2-oxoglutarate aldolase
VTASSAPGERLSPASGADAADRPALPDGLAECPAIAIFRRLPRPRVLAVAGALRAAGIRVMELTVDSPDALQLISELRSRGDALAVGAGTILDLQAARRAVDAGASFLVSPHTDDELLEFSRSSGAPLIPGAATASEVVRAWRGGATAVKLFPASSLGLGTLVALRDPLPDVRFIAVGGIDASNAGEFVRAGCVAVGVGSWLAAGGDAVQAAARAVQLVNSLSAARSQ